MLRLEGVEIPMEGTTLRADFTIEAGARIAVIGPSGAGKSTLLDAIAGFRAVSAGRLVWQGADWAGLPPERRPVAILFQDGNLFPHLSVARNLSLALRPDGRRPGKGDLARVEQALARVGLSGLGGRRPGTLSGGQRGRAALARVLLQARPILLLDEPFAALGPALKAEMLDLVKDVTTEIGALTALVSHDPEDARRFAEHTVVVTDGVAAAPEDTSRLFSDPPVALRRYLGS